MLPWPQTHSGHFSCRSNDATTMEGRGGCEPYRNVGARTPPLRRDRPALALAADADRTPAVPGCRHRAAAADPLVAPDGDSAGRGETPARRSDDDASRGARPASRQAARADRSAEPPGRAY